MERSGIRKTGCFSFFYDTEETFQRGAVQETHNRGFPLGLGPGGYPGEGAREAGLCALSRANPERKLVVVSQFDMGVVVGLFF